MDGAPAVAQGQPRLRARKAARAQDNYYSDDNDS
jgi:hypothetical protein